MAQGATSIKILSCNIGSSEEHNRRSEAYIQEMKKQDRLYVRTDLSHLNESWAAAPLMRAGSLQEYDKQLRAFVKEKTGRALSTTVKKYTDKKTGKVRLVAGSSPIREGVLVINQNTSMSQIQSFVAAVEQKYGIKALSIYTHKDEGHYKGEEWKPNLHAHIVFDWINHDTGKTYSYGKDFASDLEDMAAQHLNMLRGDKKQETGKRHLTREEFITQEKVKAAKQAAQKAQQAQQAAETARNNAVQTKEQAERNKQTAEQATAAEQRKRDEIKKEKDNLIKELDGENGTKGLRATVADLRKEEQDLKTAIANLPTAEQAQAEYNKKAKELQEKFDKKAAELDNNIEEKQKEYDTLESNYNDLQEKIKNIPTAEQLMKDTEELRTQAEELQDKYDNTHNKLSILAMAVEIKRYFFEKIIHITRVLPAMGLNKYKINYTYKDNPKEDWIIVRSKQKPDIEQAKEFVIEKLEDIMRQEYTKQQNKGLSR